MTTESLKVPKFESCYEELAWRLLHVRELAEERERLRVEKLARLRRSWGPNPQLAAACKAAYARRTGGHAE